MKDLAPVVLFVYNRPVHTEKTIDSLLKNSLAEFSDLFIFSDGPKSSADNHQVENVRSYIHKVKGFRSIKIQESTSNIGLAKSIISGVSKILNAYDRVIVMEDDIVTSKYFLTFINEALNFYKWQESIYSVTGYGFRFKIPESYIHKVYLSPRPSSWAWGTWKFRWFKADWELKDYEIFLNDRELIKRFNRGGQDLSIMLKRFKEGKIDSWAVRWAYAHFKQKAYCLYPVLSYANNIGNDNTGTHFKRSTKFEAKIYESEAAIDLPKDIKPDEEVIESFRKLFTPSLFRKINNYFYLKS